MAYLVEPIGWDGVFEGPFHVACLTKYRVRYKHGSFDSREEAENKLDECEKTGKYECGSVVDDNCEYVYKFIA
jgi:hypothetical protein